MPPPLFRVQDRPFNEPFDLGPYSADIDFVHSWPDPPNITNGEATVTPGTFDANNVNGRRLILTSGDYGTISPGNDQRYMLQPGAIIQQLNYAGSSRLLVGGQSPRQGIIRSIIGDDTSQHVLFDGANFEHTPGMSGATSIRLIGHSISMANCSGRCGGYTPSAFGTTEAALENSIVANNHFISDPDIAKTGESAQSLSRMQEVHRQIWVHNYQENRWNAAGARWHANTYGNEDIAILEGIIWSNNASAGLGLSVNPGSGGGTPVGTDRLTIKRMKIYQVTGANAAFQHDAHPTIRATNVILHDNEAYAAIAGFPESETSWDISNNSENPYEAPETALSFLGFEWLAS